MREQAISLGGGFGAHQAPAAWLRKAFAGVVLSALNVHVWRRGETALRLRQGPCIVTANHVSLLDGLLIALASPTPLVFAVDPEYSVRGGAARLGMRFLALMGYGRVVPLDRASPHGVRALLRALRAGESVMVFPEGMISPDGQPLPERAGVAWLAARARVPRVDLRISGAQHSRLFGKCGSRWRPRISLHF